MTGDSPPDLLTEYVTLLREFGLSSEAIRDLHVDDEAPEDTPLEEFVARRVDADSPRALFSRLVETLTQSRRGISATASYWNYAPEVHLNEVFEPYGCSVTFRDTTHSTGGASIEIELEDAGGATHDLRFEYPDTPLGDDNLPALLDAVETKLLSETDLTFVLLAGIDRRWRAVLIEADRLAELERRHGDGIEFAGVSLVRDDQPAAFASGEAVEVASVLNGLRGETDQQGAFSTERKQAPDADALRVTPGSEAPIDDGPAADPGAVLDGTPDDLLDDRPAERTATTPSGVEASDQELQQVFGDLSDVSLEPTASGDRGWEARTNDPPVLELGTGADVESTDDADEDPEALDGLFDEIERAAITGDDGIAEPSGGGAAVVVGAADAGPTPAGAGRHRDREASNADAEPTLEALLGDAETGEEDTDSEAVGATDAAHDDADETADSPGEFEWLSEQELAER
ncbi:hypothetical protein SAMN06269185_0594 [Natronoarchaeum philippinense]|uniref:Uncharacterized protein n=1 Tax=Natronoarchaeum philippinense TaxID=558529 RepID=A0A285N4Y5_NATPI|nr:hypothetical protein [Natronoarchaeum philippinense]SNZ04535.1 hypothetical protein SAMN06269185_0594 [Natronoarchaeum philippinense]